MHEEAKTRRDFLPYLIHSLKGPTELLEVRCLHAALEEEESNRLYTCFQDATPSLADWETDTVET